MMKTLREELDETLVGDLSFAGMTVQRHILDAIACRFHNEGWSLDGNNEESDSRWLARSMWLRAHPMLSSGQFDSLTEEERLHWQQLAKVAIEALPGLMARIAYRAVTWSKALRTLERAVRAHNPYRDKPRLHELGDDFEPCWCGHVRALHGLEACVGKDRNHDKKPCNCTRFRSMDTQKSNGEPEATPAQ